MEARRQQRKIVAGAAAVIMLLLVVVTVMPTTYASSHHKSDNSTGSTLSTPTPSPPQQPTVFSCNSSTKQPCPSPSPPSPSPAPLPSPQPLFTCPDKTVINLSLTSQCPSSSSGSSGSGSSSKGSSIGSVSVIGTKNSTKSILSCFNASSTKLMNQYTAEQKQIMSENFSALAQSLGKPSLTNFNGNHTFIQGLQIALSDCFTQLKQNETSGSSSNTTAHTTHTATVKWIGTNCFSSTPDYLCYVDSILKVGQIA